MLLILVVPGVFSVIFDVVALPVADVVGVVVFDVGNFFDGVVLAIDGISADASAAVIVGDVIVIAVVVDVKLCKLCCILLVNLESRIVLNKLFMLFLSFKSMNMLTL